jgi:L-threonylcarbamoyladenylate synthase
VNAGVAAGRNGERRFGTRVLPALGPGDELNVRTLRVALAWLTRGIPVVVPTETVYGLAAPAQDPRAVARIFEVKQRPSDNPLIVHVANAAQLYDWAGDLPKHAQALAAAFWPGPLTLVLHARPARPWVSAGLDSVALRHPAHPFMRELVLRAGPLAAPSANRSGRPSPTRAEHAELDLAGRVPLVVDGGALEHGLESTVVDVRGGTPVLLRAGVISREQLAHVVDGAIDIAATNAVAHSPGMKYRHYSPRAELWLFPEETGGARAFSKIVDRLADRRFALLAQSSLPGCVRFHRLAEDSAQVGRELFDALRTLDAADPDVIVVEGIAATGVGVAVMDRLTRAASWIWNGTELVSNTLHGEDPERGL